MDSKKATLSELQTLLDRMTEVHGASFATVIITFPTKEQIELNSANSR